MPDLERGFFIMASVNHKGGRAKTRTRIMSFLRHNDKEIRAITKQHKNKHIDKSLTTDNTSLYGRTPSEIMAIHDSTLHDLCETRNYKSPRAKANYMARVGSGAKNGIVTFTTLESTIPRAMENEPLEIRDKWRERVLDTVKDVYPDIVILEVYTHRDEIHEYRDVRTGEKMNSLEHDHITCMPVIDGELNNKKFSSRGNMKRLNYEIHKMTVAEFGCDYLTSETPMMMANEELKAQSKALQVIFEDLEASKAQQLENEAKSKEVLEDLETRAKKLKDDEAHHREMLKKEGERLEKREAQLKQKENELEALSTRLAMMEADQTAKFEDLEAQKKAVASAEADVLSRELKVTKATSKVIEREEKVEEILKELTSISEQEKEAYRRALMVAGELRSKFDEECREREEKAVTDVLEPKQEQAHKDGRSHFNDLSYAEIEAMAKLNREKKQATELEI